MQNDGDFIPDGDRHLLAADGRRRPLARRLMQHINEKKPVNE